MLTENVVVETNPPVQKFLPFGLRNAPILNRGGLRKEGLAD